MRLAALVRRASVFTDSGWNAQVRPFVPTWESIAMLHCWSATKLKCRSPRASCSRASFSRSITLSGRPHGALPSLTRTGPYQAAGCVYAGTGECGSVVVLVSSPGVAHGAGNARGSANALVTITCWQRGPRPQTTHMNYWISFPDCANLNWQRRWPWRANHNWKAEYWRYSIQNYLVGPFPAPAHWLLLH